MTVVVIALVVTVLAVAGLVYFTWKGPRPMPDDPLAPDPFAPPADEGPPEVAPEDWAPEPDPGPIAESTNLDDLVDPATGKLREP